MINDSFSKICLITLCAGLVAFCLLTWTTGYYFSFSTAWENFRQWINIAPNFSFSALDDLISALSKFSNTNVLGFKKTDAPIILQVVKIVLNAIVYLISLFSIPVEIIVAFIKLLVQTLIFASLCIDGLSSVVRNSWIPIGQGGFILPEDWYGLLTRVPFIM